jgi:hypothetical protein
MLSLAYAGEAPELRADEFLSVRSVHPEQMTYEMTNSRPEIDRFAEIFTPHLSRRGRIRMRVAWALEPAARLPRLTRLGWVYLVHYVLGPIRRRLVTPVLTGAAICSSMCPSAGDPRSVIATAGASQSRGRVARLVTTRACHQTARSPRAR